MATKEVASWGSLTKDQQDKYIVKFVEDMWKFSEKETLPDRMDWSEGYQLFRGIQDWGEDREENPWQSRAFIHLYSKVVRRLAAALSTIIFEKKDFFTLEANDKSQEGNVEMARIFEKIVRYDLRRLKFQRLFNDFALHGGITGIGPVKVWVENEVKYKGDIILKEIEEQEQKVAKSLGKDIEKQPYQTNPDDPESIDALIQEAADDLFEKPSDLKTTRSLGPKKYVEFCIKAAVKNPLNLCWEPNSDYFEESDYVIDRMDMRAYQIFKQFEAGILDKDRQKDFQKNIGNATRAATISSFAAGTFIKSQVKNQLEEADEANAANSSLEVFEYYGPLLWKDGSIIAERQRFVVAASTLLLKRTNPYFSQKPPYVAATFSKSPNKSSGEGVADGGREQQRIMNDLFSTFLDLLKLAIYAPKVVDDTSLRDASDLDEGFYPNMVIKTFGGKSASEIISDVPFRADVVANPLFQAMQKLEATAIAGAGVDVQNANQASRARISATEVQNNSNNSSDSILNLGRELDETFLEPIIQKIVEYRLQYGLEKDSLENLKMNGVLNDAEFDLIADIPPIERYNEVQSNFKVSVKGFRERFERQTTLQNLNQFLAQVGNLNPQVQAKIDWNNALEDIVDAHGFDGSRWLFQRTPQDKAAEENVLLLNEQQLTPGEQDEDAQELPIHFSGALQGGGPAMMQHIVAHLARLSQMGAPLPDVPPEVMSMMEQSVPPQVLAAIGLAPAQPTIGAPSPSEGIL